MYSNKTIVLDVQKPDLGQLRTTVKVNSIIHLFNGVRYIYICYNGNEKNEGIRINFGKPISTTA